MGTDISATVSTKIQFTGVVKKRELRKNVEVEADNFLEQFGDTQPHQFFLEYMENTWIGRHRRNPLFPKEMWNAKDITEFQLPRTTNSIESWHKILQNTFGFTIFNHLVNCLYYSFGELTFW